MLYILIALMCLIAWQLYKNNCVVDHTADPLSVPCPCCQTASIVGAMGQYQCPSCHSQWFPNGVWVLRFACDNCNSRPSKIQQDYYNENLYLLTFPCGRVGRYNHSTKAKCDVSPCRCAVTETLQNPINFSTNSAAEEECGTPVQPQVGNDDDFFENEDWDDYNYPKEPLGGPPPTNPRE